MGSVKFKPTSNRLLLILTFLSVTYLWQ